jgi:hypothetical protein
MTTEFVSHEEFRGRALLTDERFVDINKRQNKLEDAVDAISKLDVKIGLLVDQLLKEQEQHDQRICTLEQKPGKRWDALVLGAVLAVAGGVVGYFIK